MLITFILLSLSIIWNVILPYRIKVIKLKNGKSIFELLNVRRAVFGFVLVNSLYASFLPVSLGFNFSEAEKFGIQLFIFVTLLFLGSHTFINSLRDNN